MPTEKIWQQWLERFYNLRRDKRGSHERPHKPILLLAILDLLDRGLLKKNVIPLSPDLVNTFKRYFEAVRQRDDKPTIENPFYHLSGDGFWQLVGRPGEHPVYQAGNAFGAAVHEKAARDLRQVPGRPVERVPRRPAFTAPIARSPTTPTTIRREKPVPDF